MLLTTRNFVIDEITTLMMIWEQGTIEDYTHTVENYIKFARIADILYYWSLWVNNNKSDLTFNEIRVMVDLFELFYYIDKP